MESISWSMGCRMGVVSAGMRTIRILLYLWIWLRWPVILSTRSNILKGNFIFLSRVGLKYPVNHFVNRYALIQTVSFHLESRGQIDLEVTGALAPNKKVSLFVARHWLLFSSYESFIWQILLIEAYFVYIEKSTI